MKKLSEQQFILLPLTGLRGAKTASTASVNFLAGLASLGERAIAPSKKLGFRILDSIHEDGAKLVEMTRESALAFKAAHAEFRLVQVRYFYPMVTGRLQLAKRFTAKSARTAKGVTVRVTSAATGQPVANCSVVAFTDFANRIGVEAKTRNNGVATLNLGAATRTLDVLYVSVNSNYWDVLRRQVKVTATGIVVKLRDVLGYPDALSHFYGTADTTAGRGIRVAIVDTGIGPHTDLAVSGGRNTVVGEAPGDYQDNGHGHGTHVAGIVGARGTPPTGVRGLAPGVDLYSYRVFGKGQEGASNYSIAKAIDAAVADGCHLINLSLGGGPSDELTREAIADARQQGSVVIAANGNDHRQPVSWPARDSRALAVSAFGRVGTFPPDAAQKLEVAAPRGRDPKDFLAAFSNIGGETDLTGPGVGIVSSIPGGYAAWNGSSMATPAVVGRVARMWGGDSALRGMAANADRSAAVIARVLSTAMRMGFGPDFEGSGRP